MNPAQLSRKPHGDELFLVPLGGTGEIGMNLNLYGHDGAWLMVDLGITFASGRLPGIDVLMPDPAFIEARVDDLAGLVLTHAHEDHIGAVPYLWPRLRCPIYATPFTAHLVRGKLNEVGLADQAPVTEVPLSGRFDVGPFAIELVTLTHSIPEPNAMVIRTAAGTVLHTGDWKFDPNPMVGDNFDEARLRALADEDVLAMVCDSTNALVEGPAGSESDVRDELTAMIADFRGRVAVACFASNVARLETVIRAAEACGRRVTLVGRSMHRILEAARETGYLTDLPPFVAEEDVDYLPRQEVLLLCTGSQGEPRSALWRIANRQHPHISLEKGDAVVFSSRIIPGNETGIFELHNALAREEIEVHSGEDRFVHVSGHPGREELAQMYQWVRPQVSVPVHGEARHLMAHAALAADCQVPQQIVSENGQVIRLAPGPAEVVDTVSSGRLAFEGRRLLSVDHPVIKTRQRMIFNGAAMVTLVVDRDGNLENDPELSLPGLLDSETDIEALDAVIEAVCDAIARLRAKERRNDEAIREVARQAVRRTTNRLFGRKPVTQVHLVRF